MTAYEYEIQHYDHEYGYGWEMVTCDETLKEAQETIALYRAEIPGIYRIKLVRCKKNDGLEVQTEEEGGDWTEEEIDLIIELGNKEAETEREGIGHK